MMVTKTMVSVSSGVRTGVVGEVEAVDGEEFHELDVGRMGAEGV